MVSHTMLLKRFGILGLVLVGLPVLLQGQNLQRADSLATVGIKYEQRGNYKEAELYLSEAVSLYRQHQVQDTSQYINTLFSYTEALFQRAKYDKALSQLEIVKPLAEQRRDTSNLTSVHNYWGLIQKYQSRFPAARKRYQKALQLAISSNDSLMIAIIHDNLGSVNLELGDYASSLEHRSKALTIFQKVGTDLNQAITLNNIGMTYINLSMYDRAYDYLSKSLSLSKNLNNTARLTTAYLNIGMVHFNLGNYDQALVSYQKALEYAQETGNPVRRSHLLVNLGNLYYRLGDIEKSLNYYQESLELVLRHNITSPVELSTKYKNIATRQVDLGQMEQARQNYHKALELRKQTGNVRELALSYLDIAQLERGRNHFDKALDYVERSKQIADSTRIRDLMVKVQVELGLIQRARGNPRRALPHFRTAYRQGRVTSDRLTPRPLALLAHTFNEIGSDSAVVYGTKLVDIIESSRSRVGELASLKSGYFENYADFYVNLASWMLKYRGDKQRAFELVEASRARTLLDELVQASKNLDDLLPVEDQLKKQRLQKTIENYQGQIDTTTSIYEKQRLKKELRSAELEYAAFMNEISAQNEGFKKLEYPTPVSAADAQALTGGDTAILEYAFADEALLIFLITRQQIRVQRVDVAGGRQDRHRITTLVEQFRDNILAHQPSHLIQAQSSELVHHLITPFFEELSGYENLMIVPDEVLAYLPFEALMVEGEYLIEQFSIKYAPSMTTFSLLKNRKERHSGHERELLAIAGSSFEGISSPLQRGEAYPPLPATLAEVDSIASKFNDAEVFKKGNFSEQFIKESLTKNYRYIHLATHGIIDEENPNLSGLALSTSPSEASGREDGMLRSSEIYQLNINSDMVVLSACNSGLGKMVNGEGMLGLQRAFFYAGVPTVSVSLWNVYDRSTAYFMDQFYSSLLNRAESLHSSWSWSSLLRWVGWDPSVPFGDAAPAMRQAKLKMLEHPLFHHPVYWAPFIVLGR
ncbi:CHAT domain-containing protein [Halalkalibaculum sp. DA384]|uniref:CHAT domain-containing protein n=1 Tax=Halalkalibaculum sp. DA384 TaxID=3373606 RepID=UPI0037541DE7